MVALDVGFVVLVASDAVSVVRREQHLLFEIESQVVTVTKNVAVVITEELFAPGTENSSVEQITVLVMLMKNTLESLPASSVSSMRNPFSG